MGTIRNILEKKGNIIFSVKPTATVFYALEMMLEKNIGALLVIDNQKFLGIFTERDYARKVILKGKSSKEAMVQEIMSEHPITASPDMTIDECMKLMTSRYIRHLPVFNGEKLVGLVSIGDLVKYIIYEQQSIIEDLEHYITGHQ